MEEKSMTALVSCFARAYYNKNSNIKIYEDNLAERILSKEEYDNISINSVDIENNFCLSAACVISFR